MLQKINAWLHLWLGLASGIIVVVVSVTGCILVFEQEFEALTQPWLHAQRPGNAAYLPPSRLHQELTRIFPDKEIHSLWYYGHGRTTKVSMDSDSVVFIDPYTAKIAGIVDHEDFFHIVLEGHTGLWIEGKLGHQIVSWATMIFFILLITGLILWWPKKWNKSGRDKSFKIKWKAKFKRVNYDLHNVLGFYSMIVALVITITGLIMGFAWFNKSVYWIASGGNAAPAYITPLSDTTQLPLKPSISIPGMSIPGMSTPGISIPGMSNVDKAFKMGIEEIGVYNKDAIIVSFPDHPADPIYLCTDMHNGSWRDNYVDQYTLKVVPGSAVQIDKLGFADWVRRANYALHVGAVGGLTTKIIYFVASLICATLPITGFYIWWGRRKKEQKNKNRYKGLKSIA